MSNPGKAIRELREERGMTQAELAALVGLSDNSAIAKRERGEVRVKPVEWKKFAAAFGIGVNDFLAACNRDESKEVATDNMLRSQLELNRIELNDLKTKAIRSMLIPLVGSIPAGWSKVVTHYEDGDFVPAHDLNAELCFACIVSGDSMVPALREGDVVVFRMVRENEESLLADGKVVACTFHETGETSVARMTKVNDRRIRLSKDNPKFKPREVNLSVDELDRIGVLVQHRKGWA